MQLVVFDHVAQIDDADWPRLEAFLADGRELGYVRSNKHMTTAFYIVIKERTERQKRYVAMLGRWLLDAPRHLVVLYKNHDTLDMRRENIRLGTTNEVQWNRRARQDVTFKGVEFSKQWGKWTAKIVTNKKRRRSGWFDTAEEAARHYDELARAEHGSAAHLNFPDSPLAKFSK